MRCSYGPREFGTEDQGWVGHVTISTLRDEPLIIFGDGTQVRNVFSLVDLVRAEDAVLADLGDKLAVYNVGGGPTHTTSLLEFLDALGAKTGHRTDINFDD